MKISKLINELEKMKEEVGDVDVFTLTREGKEIEAKNLYSYRYWHSDTIKGVRLE